MKKVFLAWKPYCARSHNLAEHFNAKITYIHPFSTDGNPALSIVRYFISFFMTLIELFRQRPNVVFTLNQPIPLLLSVFIYSKASGSCYILDSHSAPFNNPILALLRPLYRVFAKEAVLNINTNSLHQSIVNSWGGKSFIIGDVPIDFNKEYPAKKIGTKSISVVASFMFDEPISEILNAAEMVPEITFYVTGNYKKAKKELI